MRIFNSTKKRGICDCKVVNPYLGLMFQQPHPVIFSFRSPIIIALHNLFVFGSTDVIFLQAGKVVDLKRGFLPFTFYTSKKPATHVIELPAGMAKSVSLDDKIRFG